MRKILYLSFSLLFSLLLLFPSGEVKASHIIGGDFNLQYLGNDSFRLTLKVFRDCENGVPGFNNPLWVGMFERNTHAYVDRFRMDLLSDTALIPDGDSCMNLPAHCAEVGLYSIVITLSPNYYSSTNGYYFSWERCCRNVAVKNIDAGSNPQGNVGMAFYMEIPPVTVENSTPVFNKTPSRILCLNKDYKFGFDVTDADGDSLVYSLVQPLWGNLDESNPNDNNQVNYPIILPGPYKPTTWNSGYSLSNIIEGNPTLTINSHTGELSIKPTSAGIYEVAIRVEEYRNGAKLGEVRRELQLIVGGDFVGINEFDEKLSAKINIYPNPATDQFSLELPQDIELQNAELLDLQGKVVSRYSAELRIYDVSGLGSGQYFLKVHTDKGVAVKRVMVK